MLKNNAYQELPSPENTASPHSQKVDRKKDHGFVTAFVPASPKLSSFQYYSSKKELSIL
jgi:hypothetical protein